MLSVLFNSLLNSNTFIKAQNKNLNLAACNNNNTLMMANEQNQSDLKVTFIANEGFLISSASKKILIDALYTTVYSPNVKPSTQLIRKMENAEPPFDNIDLILVTHDHNDHFDMNCIAQHLENDKDAVLVCPNTVGSTFRSYSNYDSIKRRIFSVTPGSGLKADSIVNGISVTILGFRHCMSNFYNMEHNSYLLNVDGVKVHHSGDSWGYTNELEALRLQNESIDVGFFEVDNFWEAVAHNPLNGLQRVVKYYNPKNIVLMHNNPAYLSGGKQIVNAVKNDFPNIYLFKKELGEAELPNGLLTNIHFEESMGLIENFK